MIFIDSGAFLGRYINQDQHHAAAVVAWGKLAGGHESLFTSNFVLDETFTLLARRGGYAFAAEKARSIMTSQALIVLRPDQENEWEALGHFEKLADQRVSFTDCVSFVLMRRSRIKRTFSFDRHFQHAGFEVWPG